MNFPFHKAHYFVYNWSSLYTGPRVSTSKIYKTPLSRQTISPRCLYNARHTHTHTQQENLVYMPSAHPRKKNPRCIKVTRRFSASRVKFWSGECAHWQAYVTAHAYLFFRPPPAARTIWSKVPRACIAHKTTTTAVNIAAHARGCM